MRIIERVLATSCLATAILLSPAPAAAQGSDVEWPFPEFTKQTSMKIKADLDDAYLKVATEAERKYALAIFPLDPVGGSLADIAAAATAGSGHKQFEVTRTTDTRIYMTRGTAAANVFGGSIITFPTEAVIELDAENSRLLVFYKIDLRGTFGAANQEWRVLLTEGARWALAAEGK